MSRSGSSERNIRLSKHRDAVDFQTRWTVRPSDILQAINELRPTVVHFSEHGTGNDELVLLDDLGEPKLIRKEAIVRAIATSTRTIKLVFSTAASRTTKLKHVPIPSAPP